MNKTIIMAAAFCVGPQILAASEVLSLQTTAQVDVKVVSMQQACAVTIDHQWDQEEDTRSPRLLLDNESYKRRQKLLEEGYRVYGNRAQEKCSVGSDNTFTYVRNSEGEEYFDVYTNTSVLLDFAQQQKAFKTVEALYIKGAEAFKEKVQKDAQKELDNLVESYQ